MGAFSPSVCREACLLSVYLLYILISYLSQYKDSIKEKEFKCFKNHLEADDLEILVPWGFIPAVMPKNGSPTFTYMQPQ